MLRSLLFVPGDRPERFEKALKTGADALILDLEDSVVPARKVFAREAVKTFLHKAEFGSAKILVRVNPLSSADLNFDLGVIRGCAPDGIMLPKAEGARSIIAVNRLLDENNLHASILPIATETPKALFQLGSYCEVAGSLIGLTWGAEDLPACIGAVTAREADGRYRPPYELVRAMALFASHACDIAAIETVYPDFRNLEGLMEYAARAREDGFTGMMAIHPSQVEIINSAFTPSNAERAYAQRIVETFEHNPDAGAVSLEGKMLDRPHLKIAQRILQGMGD